MPLKMIVAAAAVAAAAVAVWFFGTRDDGGGSAHDVPTNETVATAPTATTLPLDDAGSELADLLARSRDATFHATYEATKPATTEGGVAERYTVDLFRDAGRTRQDTATALSGGDYLTSGILRDGVSIVCAKQGTADWVCSQNEVDDESVADGIFGQIVDQLGGVEVTATDETIDGREVRCFSYETAEGPGSMCLTGEGIPVRILGGDTELVLTELTDDVPDDAFEPPAEPVQAEAPS